MIDGMVGRMICEVMGAPPPDAQIVADEIKRDATFAAAWDAASEQERADWLEQARGRAEYNMTPAEYEKYVAGQREMAVYVSTAGMSPEIRGARMEEYAASVAAQAKKMPGWVWLAAGGGVLALLLVRK